MARGHRARCRYWACEQRSASAEVDLERVRQFEILLGGEDDCHRQSPVRGRFTVPNGIGGQYPELSNALLVIAGERHRVVPIEEVKAGSTVGRISPLRNFALRRPATVIERAEHAR